MVFPDRDWEERRPEDQGVDPGKLDAALHALERQCGKCGTREVVVIRNGFLIWKGDDIDRRHKVQSCTKMIVGTLYGLLLDDGRCSLDDPASRYESRLDGRFPEYREIEIHHFLTHTSGYNAEGGRYHTDNADGGDTPWIPDRPHFVPGTKFGYWDDAVNMSGIVLARILGRGVLPFFRERVTDPIGIPRSALDWEQSAVLDGIQLHNYSGGVITSACAFARIGHLFLNQGNWDGRQLISREWVAESTTNRVPASLPLSYYTAADCRGMQGYHWWLNGTRPSGQRAFPDAPAGLFFTVGTGHNKLFVIPEWDMVIVRLGEDFPCPSVEDRLGIWNQTLGMISRAVES